MKVAALYVATGGAYFGLPDVIPYDGKTPETDARLYGGPWPVVAHPSCGPWCQLAPVNQKRYGHKVGDDGGRFASALASVRTWGGVLEHPVESYAWPRFNLLRPVFGEWRRSIFDGSWVTEVEQGAYGHRARKRTWLYYVCNTAPSEPPELDWSRSKPTACVSYMKNHRPPNLPRLTKKQASATPLPFRDLLLSMARSARKEAA